MSFWKYAIYAVLILLVGSGWTHLSTNWQMITAGWFILNIVDIVCDAIKEIPAASIEIVSQEDFDGK